MNKKFYLMKIVVALGVGSFGLVVS